MIGSSLMICVCSKLKYFFGSGNLGSVDFRNVSYYVPGGAIIRNYLS